MEVFSMEDDYSASCGKINGFIDKELYLLRGRNKASFFLCKIEYDCKKFQL